MSVILEFTIASEDFRLGQVLEGPSEMQFELERIVPTGHMVLPFVWATGDDHAAFEENVRAHPVVKELYVLDILGDSGLYRVEWDESPTNLIEAIAAADASVLEARGNGDWLFRLRFNDHDKLSQFHNYIIDQGMPIHIDRTYTLSEATGRGHRFDLTQDQREALLMALQRGYFATPREVTLDDLADDLGITRQALSDRIRRANEKVLRGTLLSSAVDFDDTT